MKENVKNLSLTTTSSIKDALKIIGKHGSKIALVFKGDKFIGILTDADIRHALVAGHTLESKIEKIYNKTPICLKAGFELQEALDLARIYDVYDFPILDENKSLLGVKSLASLLASKKRSQRVLIMAGGLGSRLYPLTKDIPKPMLKIQNKPILQIILERFIKQGFSDFYISVNYKKEVIKNYFLNEFLKARITYLEEEFPLGTAGGLYLYKQELLRQNEPLDKNFLLINADLLIKLEFEKLLAKLDEKTSLVMALRKLSYEFPFGVVEQKRGLVKEIKEKPKMEFLINAGIYALKEQLLLKLASKPQRLDMPEFINQLLASGEQIASYEFAQSWIDIGSLQDYERAKEA